MAEFQVEALVRDRRPLHVAQQGSENRTMTARLTRAWRTKLVYAGALLTAIAIVSLLWLPDFHGPTTQPIPSDGDTNEAVLLSGDDGTEAQSSPVTDVSVDVGIGLASSTSVSSSQSIWTTDVASDRDTYPSLPSYYNERADKVLVQVRPPRSIAVGDEMTVEIPQLGRAYRVTIDHVGLGAGQPATGYTTDDSGRRHNFVLTVGTHTTFASIGTPHGSFELVAKDGLGWLMPAIGKGEHDDLILPSDRLEMAARRRSLQ